MSSPDPTWPVEAQVQELIQVRRADDALRIAHDALALDPTDPTLRALVGWSHLAAGRCHEARAWFEWSLEEDPQQGWVHDLRARAILAGAGTPNEAERATALALAEDPHDADALSTAVIAHLEAGYRDKAADAAALLRWAHPASPLAPLAEARVELARGHVYRRPDFAGWAVVMVIATGGGGLLVVGIAWVVHAIRRVPHLRRADELVREALALDPSMTSSRRLLAEIMALRFQFAGAVEGDVVTAALDAGMVDAGRLARSIARRTAVSVAVASLAGLLLASLVGEVAPDAVTVAVSVTLAVVGLVAVVRLERWQTRHLPVLIRRRVRGDVVPLLVGAAVVALLSAWGLQVPGATIDDPSRPTLVASLAALPVALGALVVRSVLAVRARRV